MHRIRWDDLFFILAVADTGSLSAAARKLGVNHATVLRRVSAFEETHGIRLFERGPRGYSLRTEYRPVLERIRQLNRSVGSLERVLAGQHDAIAGTVRVTSTDTVCKAILAPSVPRFRDLYPDVIVDLASTNLHLDLSRLDADVTVRPTNSLPAELSGRRVGEMVFRIYASVGYLSRNTSLRKDQHDWLGVNDALARSLVLVWQKDALPADRIVFRTDSFITMAEAAAANMGLAMLPCFLGDRMPGLIRASGFRDRLSSGVWIAAHRDLVDTPRIGACLAFFAEVVEDNAALLLGQPV